MRNSYEVLLSKYNEIQKAMKEEQKMRINNNNDSDNDEKIEEYQRKIEEINDEYNKLLTKFVYIILYYYYLQNEVSMELQQKNIEQTDNSNHLNNSITDLQDNISNLNEKLIIKEETRIKLETQLKKQEVKYEKELSELKDQVNSLELENKRLQNGIVYYLYYFNQGKSTNHIDDIKNQCIILKEENDNNNIIISELQSKLSEVQNINVLIYNYFICRMIQKDN